MTVEQEDALQAALRRRLGARMVRDMSLVEISRLIRDMQEEVKLICEEADKAYDEARRWVLIRLMRGER